jgi:hypothetical protein
MLERGALKDLVPCREADKFQHDKIPEDGERKYARWWEGDGLQPNWDLPRESGYTSIRIPSIPSRSVSRIT